LGWAGPAQIVYVEIIAKRLANSKRKKLSGKLSFVMARKKKKDPAAVSLGRRGGKARLTKLTPEARSEIARKGGLAGGRGRKKQGAK
jgi:hypothetical protein